MSWPVGARLGTRCHARLRRSYGPVCRSVPTEPSWVAKTASRRDHQGSSERESSVAIVFQKPLFYLDRFHGNVVLKLKE